MKPLLRRAAGLDSATCRQAHPKSRAAGNQLCRKERKALAVSSLLSTMSLTAALWHIVLLPAP